MNIEETEIKNLNENFSSFSVIFEEEEDIDFESLFDKSFENLDEHAIIIGKIAAISKDFVNVDIGYKSEGRVPIEEFSDESGTCDVNLGDDVEVFVEALEDEDGETLLSHEKAKKLRIWEKVGQVYEDGGTVDGVITARIKGGLSVDIGIRAFLPGSQVDLRPVRNLDKLIGESFQFKILKFNQQRGNIVLSRRALLEVEREERRKKTLEILEEGILIKGNVKNITDYGVFIDLGGVDGLLHITDITWGRIVHPSEMFNLGDEVEVTVLKYDPDEQKVSLGLKQKTANPWENVAEKYPVGTRIVGKIVSLTDYGSFIELEPGVEGLIHVSEMSWTKKVRNPNKVVSLGDTVEAIVKELDVERKRISLSMKEAQPNPWKLAMDRYPVDSVVKGKVRNVTDFGVFVGLEEGIDGLVHISDISWSQRQRRPSELFKKGDEIEVRVLNIDVEQERLSLGIKQLTEDPWKNLDEKYQVNSEVSGKIVNITDFGIFVEVLEGVEGLVHISEIDSAIPKAKLTEFYPLGTEVRSRVIKIDPADRRLGLSILESRDVKESFPKKENESDGKETSDEKQAGESSKKGSKSKEKVKADSNDVKPDVLDEKNVVNEPEINEEVQAESEKKEEDSQADVNPENAPPSSEEKSQQEVNPENAPPSSEENSQQEVNAENAPPSSEENSQQEVNAENAPVVEEAETQEESKSEDSQEKPEVEPQENAESQPEQNPEENDSEKVEEPNPEMEEKPVDGNTENEENKPEGQ